MKTSIQKAALRGAASLSVFVLLCGSAYAQNAAPQGADDSTVANDPIIVTGSRIARQELDAPNPVTVVTSKDLRDSGTTNLTDYLQTIPALLASAGSYDSSGDRAPIGYTGLNLLNLRNMGTERTLVLIDGRRHVASVDGTQSVDINTMPTDLVDRVEVLTGGASAIYGADGVTGVVNFIQKKDFEGLTARVQTGVSSRGDAGQRLIALTAGHNFDGGRGNIALAWEQGAEDRLSSHSRKYLDGENKTNFYLNPADDPEDGTPYYKYVPLKNIRYNDTSRAGGIDIDLDGYPDFYGADGAAYDNGTFVPRYYQQGGSGTLASDYGNDILPEIKRNIVSGVFHYDFSDAFTLYAEGKYARTRSFSEAQPTWDYYLFIRDDNPYIPASVRPYIDPENGGVLINRDNFDFGRRGEDITRTTLRGVLGAKGALSPNLNYDVSYVYGRTRIKSISTNNMITDRYLAAIDAVSDGNGGVTCRANLDPNWEPFQPLGAYGTRHITSTRTFEQGDCHPLNLFGENNASNKAALDWIMTDSVDYTTITQNVLSAALTGTTKGSFELPGGPLGYAVGGEYRKEKSTFTADDLAQQGVTFLNSLGDNRGSFDVWEIFAEIDAPLLTDSPFAKRLDLNFAARYSDYSSIGSTNTWKIGAEWAPVRDIMFRGTYSKAVRAPNISELYGSNSQTYSSINDPCLSDYVNLGTTYRKDNCTVLLSSLGADAQNYSDQRGYTIAGYAGSNPNLREETAKTWTAGVVLQPSFIPRLLVTADWYDIRIKNAINTASAEELAELCVDQSTLDNQYCNLVIRQNGSEGSAAAGNIISYNLTPYNVAEKRTSGLDFQISYTQPTDKTGTFGLRLIGNYLHRLTSIPITGADAVNEAYVASEMSPKFQITTDLTWAKGPFSLDWQINYLSKMYRYDRQDIKADPDIVAPKYLKLKERFTHDVSFNYDVDEKLSLYGGVNNLFDQKPAIGSQNTPISAVGRYFFVGARVKMPDFFGGAK